MRKQLLSLDEGPLVLVALIRVQDRTMTRMPMATRYFSPLRLSAARGRGAARGHYAATRLDRLHIVSPCYVIVAMRLSCRGTMLVYYCRMLYCHTVMICTPTRRPPRRTSSITSTTGLVVVVVVGRARARGARGGRRHGARPWREARLELLRGHFRKGAVVLDDLRPQIVVAHLQPYRAVRVRDARGQA